MKIYAVLITVYFGLSFHLVQAQSQAAPVTVQFTHEEFAKTLRDIFPAIEHALRAELAAAAMTALSSAKTTQVRQSPTIELGRLVVGPRQEQWIHSIRAGLQAAYADTLSDDEIEARADAFVRYIENSNALQLEANFDLSVDPKIKQIDWQGSTIESHLQQEEDSLAILDSRNIVAAPLIHLQNFSASIYNPITNERVSIVNFGPIQNENGNVRFGFDEFIQLPELSLQARTRITTDFFNQPQAPFRFSVDEVRLVSPDGSPANIEIPEQFMEDIRQRVFTPDRYLDIADQFLALESSQELIRIAGDQLHGILNSLEHRGLILQPTFWVMRDQTTGRFLLEKALATGGEIPDELKKHQADPNLKVIAITHSDIALNSNTIELSYDSATKRFLADIDLPEHYEIKWQVDEVDVAEFFRALGTAQLEPLVESFEQNPIQTDRLDVTTTFRLPLDKKDDIKIQIPIIAVQPDASAPPILQLDMHSPDNLEMPGLKQAVPGEVLISTNENSKPLILDLESSVPLSQQVHQQASLILDHFLSLTFNDDKEQREQALALVVNNFLNSLDASQPDSFALPIAGGALQFRNLHLTQDAIEVMRLENQTDLDGLIREYGLTKPFILPLQDEQRKLAEKEPEFRIFVGIDLPQELGLRLLDLQTPEASVARMDLNLQTENAPKFGAIIKFIRDGSDQLIPILEYDSFDDTLRAYSPILEGAKRPHYSGLIAKGDISLLGLDTGVNKNLAIIAGHGLASSGTRQSVTGITQIVTAPNQGFFSGLWSSIKGAANLGVGGVKALVGTSVTNNADEQVLDAISNAWTNTTIKLPDSIRRLALQQVGFDVASPLDRLVVNTQIEKKDRNLIYTFSPQAQQNEPTLQSPLASINQQIIDSIDQLIQDNPVNRPIGEIEMNGDSPFYAIVSRAERNLDDLVNGTAAYPFVARLPFTNPQLHRHSTTITQATLDRIRDIGRSVIPLLESPTAPSGIASALNAEVAPLISETINQQFQNAISGPDDSTPSTQTDAGFPIPNAACFAPDQRSDTMTILAYAAGNPALSPQPEEMETGAEAHLLYSAIEKAILAEIPNLEKQLYELAQWRIEELPDGRRKKHDRAFVNDSLVIDIDKGEFKPKLYTVSDANDKPVLMAEIRIHASQKTYGPFQQEASPATDWLFALMSGFQADLETSDGDPSRAGIKIRVPVEIVSVSNINGEENKIKSYRIGLSLGRFKELGEVSGGNGKWSTLANRVSREVIRDQLPTINQFIEIPAIALPGLQDYFSVAIENPRVAKAEVSQPRLSVPIRLQPSDLATQIAAEPTAVIVNVEDFLNRSTQWLSSPSGVEQLQAYLNTSIQTAWSDQSNSAQEAPFIINFENPSERAPAVLHSEEYGYHIRIPGKLRENLPDNQRPNWSPVHAEFIIPYALYAEKNDANEKVYRFRALGLKAEKSDSNRANPAQIRFLDALEDFSFKTPLSLEHLP